MTFVNLDLLSVGVAIAGIGVLGFIVYFTNRQSITNKSFLLFSVISVAWGSINYLSYKFSSPSLTLWLLRMVIAFAVWHVYSLFQLIYVFPRDSVKFPKLIKYLILPLVGISSVINLTPLSFNNVSSLGSPGSVSVVSKGPGMLLFVLVVASLAISSLIFLIKKIRISEGIQKRQLLIVFVGILLTFLLILTFNFFLPAFFDQVTFIPLGALFLLPFVVFTFYSIIQHGLLNIKIISTEILTIALAIVSFAEIIFASSLTQIIFRTGIFTLVLVVGVLLIKGVLREVEQREKISALADGLANANEKLRELDRLKSEFVSDASHQLRSPLTAIKGYSSMLLEGSFGEIGEKAREAIEIVFQSSQKLATVIEDYLNLTRIELGRMKYEITTFDLKDLVASVIKELQPNIDKKREITFSFDHGSDNYTIHADNGKISQVISNLIDNALKYTPKGFVKVAIEKLGNKIQLTVSDSGVGIDTITTLPRLFEKFSRADASKQNRQGVGLGLYIAKQIVEAHKGKIWAESEGRGKGSTFYLEFLSE